MNVRGNCELNESDCLRGVFVGCGKRGLYRRELFAGEFGSLVTVGLQYSWLLGQDEYMVAIQFSSGDRIDSAICTGPKATWKGRDSDCYVSCYDLRGECWIGSVDRDGKLTYVSRADILEENMEWNLVSKDAREYWDAELDLWAK